MSGTLKKMQLSLSYAQYFALLDNRLKIIPSLQASYLQKSLDVNSLHYGDLIDPEFGVFWTSRLSIPAPNKRNFDCSTGLLLNYKDIYGGITVKHITQPDMGLFGINQLPRSYNLHVSWNKKCNDKTLLQFFALYTKQGNFQSARLSVNAVMFKHLLLGAAYISNKSSAFNVGFRDNIVSGTVGYMTTYSKLAGNTAGTWVLAFSINLKNKELRKELTNFETW